MAARAGHCPYPLLELRGTPVERGRAYGRAAARQIRAARDFYLARWDMSADELEARVQNFVPALETFDADLVDEVRGMAAGSGCSFAEVLAINARNEIMFGGPRDAEGCTIMAVRPPASADGGVYMAQNWDWAHELSGTAVVLRIFVADRPTILTFVDAGRLAMHGLNEAGLGLCGNYLETPEHPGQPGIPIPFLRRRLLSCESVAEAAALLDATPRSTCSNYLLAHRSGDILDCEATPQTVFRGSPADSVLVHTNHFRYPDPPINDYGLVRLPDSKPRAERAEVLLAQHVGTIDVTVLKGILSDHLGYPASICRHGDNGPNFFTLASHVMDLERGTMHLAAGPPCAGTFHVITT